VPVSTTLYVIILVARKSYTNGLAAGFIQRSFAVWRRQTRLAAIGNTRRLA
jgi:hypothetical protein